MKKSKSKKSKPVRMDSFGAKAKSAIKTTKQKKTSKRVSQKSKAIKASSVKKDKGEYWEDVQEQEDPDNTQEEDDFDESQPKIENLDDGVLEEKDDEDDEDDFFEEDRF